MIPVRDYADPHEGLEAQLTELLGLTRIVPRLIQEDRERRWDEINRRPGDPDKEAIDVFGEESGPQEGWGFADYDHTIFLAAIVTAWEAFRDCLNRQLFASTFDFDLRRTPQLAALVADARRNADRSFDFTIAAYKKYCKLSLAATISDWSSVQHAQELRNALVHNLGMYTERYARNKLAILPEEFGQETSESADLDRLVDSEQIPLSETHVGVVIASLVSASAEVRDALLGKSQGPR